MNNVEKIVSNELCTGCGMCKIVCPVNAIKITIDDRTKTYTPIVDNLVCTNCSVCLKVCPGEEVNFKMLNEDIFHSQPRDSSIGIFNNLYLGYSLDDEIRQKAASGGLISQILIYLLEEKIIDGALVTRMKKDNPLEPEPFIAKTKEEIIEASKSKYCPVPVNIALAEIINSNSYNKIAIVGLPCHLHAIRKAEKLNSVLKQKVVLHLGLLCSSGKSFLATDYQLSKMKIRKDKIERLQYRGDGWPGSFKIDLKDGNTYSVSQPEYYNNKFCSFTPWRCTLCIDETAELSDISFGDAWIPEIRDIDKKGTSIIISRNHIGEELLQELTLKKKINLQHTTKEKLIISQGGFKRKKFYVSRSKIVSKLFRKKVPNYIYFNYDYKDNYFDYLISILLYIRYFCIYNPKLWRILELYCDMLSYFSKKTNL